MLDYSSSLTSYQLSYWGSPHKKTYKILLEHIRPRVCEGAHPLLALLGSHLWKTALIVAGMIKEQKYKAEGCGFDSR
jgi:hypothetical protein